eukprot:CAMPEP_0179090526 /NCGR_PEP_ID=MMETSP0796-20121207/41306_1 /TAXON_ID=73915 /ORGANISM="Pyrodinium bahamense, Strain pbaha01" /LENGTH=263 /DNA_ID=CAMNT_0020788101 /DNA_START=48 /DNA_END=839 /DNA_ORIENTATION=+
MLASCFSGRWDSSLPRDQEGACHVDFDPDIFMPLLTFLRAKRIEDPSEPAVIVPPEGRYGEFLRMLKYYGMEESVLAHHVPNAAEFQFEAHDEHPNSITVWLSENGRVARRSGCPYWLCTFGDVVVAPRTLSQPLTFKFCIASFGDPGGCGPSRGPCLGFAVSSQQAQRGLEFHPSDMLDTTGKWLYCARDGALLTKSKADAARKHAPSANEGDKVSLTIFPDATVTLAVNGMAVGVVFRNLGGSVRPVVLMNRKDSEVQIVH